jgi:hypothetical protein
VDRNLEKEISSMTDQRGGEELPSVSRVNIGTAAAICGIKRDAINEAMRMGALRFKRVNGQRTATLQDVHEFKRVLWSRFK